MGRYTNHYNIYPSLKNVVFDKKERDTYLFLFAPDNKTKVMFDQDYDY